MKTKEEYLIGVQFPNKRSPRDFSMVLIAMQKYGEDYHVEQLRQIDEAEIEAIKDSECHPKDISDEDIMNEANRIKGQVGKFFFDPTSFQYGAQAMRDGIIPKTTTKKDE